MKSSKIIVSVLMASAPMLVCAQQIASLDAPGMARPDATPSVSVTSVKPVDASPNWQHSFARWFDVNTASTSFRYRSETAIDDYRYISNGQYRNVLDGRVKLDAAARYTINFHLSSGRTFNWAYTDSINPDFVSREGLASILALSPQMQTILFGALAEGYPISSVPSRGGEMYFRQLYGSATPVSWLTAEYGSLPIEHGQSSEITSYDDDGYISGERLRFHAPSHVYFDEMDVTYAYRGDVYNPNFFTRAGHLKNSNYHQFLVAKHFGDRVKASVDYTFDNKTHVLREAVLLKLPETKVVDSLRAEFYERPNQVYVGTFPFSGGAGLALTAEKVFEKRFKLDGGYEQVDLHYGGMESDVLNALAGFSFNGDAYSTGKHVFADLNVKLTPYASLNGFYIHQVVQPPANEFAFAKEGFNGGVTVDVKRMFEHPKSIF